MARHISLPSFLSTLSTLSTLFTKRAKVITVAAAGTLTLAAAISAAAVTVPSPSPSLSSPAPAGADAAFMTTIGRQVAQTTRSVDGIQQTVAFRARVLQAKQSERVAAAARAADARRAAAAKAASAKAALATAAAKRAAASRTAPAQQTAVTVSSGSPEQIAEEMLGQFGWSASQFSCLQPLWQRESGWNLTAQNPSSGAYGIPQALPGSKMASAGADWQTNAATQIRWGLGYIQGSYGSPCGAWAHEQADGWY